MAPSLVAGCLWIVTAALVALLPWRRQIGPGLVLAAAAPPVLLWIGAEAGWAAAALGLLAVLSMMRRPLAGALRGLRRTEAGA
ncbi:DUF2484 family protein [Rubellimicrobium sp. CFH 75288]|uniref:DUF2484 family protein n=1 Tax=Rubellimicrobium sp. CFH 75288 TaxID=2697034 RepID=UPI0014126635|nr:DUF2484 family protein [Rubellimicrobium sp. CFH 75288]NAZ36402.1 DUF2484 family protein [Rubellimicrobium sp. CFH 75288]